MKRHLHRCPAAFIVFAAVVSVSSCINSDYRFDIDDVDTGVNLFPEGVTLPLVTIDRKTLASILEEEIDELTLNEDGYYTLRYDDRFDFQVDPINIPSIGGIGDIFPDIQMDVDLPDLDFSESAEISPLYLARYGALPISGSISAGSYTGSVRSNEGEIDIDFGLPEEISSIGTVWLGPADEGSQVSVRINMGTALQSVNNRFVINSLVVDLPARYTLGNPSVGTIGAGTDGGTANRLTVTDYDMGTSPTAVITFYIQTFTLADKVPSAVVNPGAFTHEITFTEPFGYELNYTVDARAGYVDPSLTAPSVVIDGNPQFRDAELTTTAVTVDSSQSETFLYRLGTIPDTVEEVVGVRFADGGNSVVITLDDLQLPFRSQEPDVRVQFPSLFSFDDPRLSGNVLTAPLSEFVAGYALALRSIDLGDDGIPAADRYIEIGGPQYPITVEISHTFPSETLRWSADIAGRATPSPVDVKMDASGLVPSAIRAKLDIDLDSYMADGIKPVDLRDITSEMDEDDVYRPDLIQSSVTMIFTNPAGISLVGDIEFDSKDKKGNSMRTVNVDGLSIESSDETGIRSSYVFIAEEGVATPTDRHYTRYDAPLGDIFEYVPTTIDINVDARIEPGVAHTVAIGEPLPFEVGYSVDVPLSFGNNMDLAIPITSSGLQGTFRDLADAKVKASDIQIGAGLRVSFPFRIEDVTAELTDGEHNSIPGLVTTVLGAIQGPQTDDGSPPLSTLTIGITVPDGGDFETLSSVDKLTVKLPISGTGDVNRLHPDDYISGKVWITLAKGVNVDLSEI